MNTKSVLFVILLMFLTVAEKVGKFEYLGATGTYNDSTMVVPADMVAMSEYVHVGAPSDIVTTGNPCSIVFVVDVSTSNTVDKTDASGVRFKVVKSVLDSIYDRNPNVQVGMVFLSSELYFNPADDDLFEKASGYMGGYLPLMKLNGEYSGTYTETNGSGKVSSQSPYTKKGIDVLKMYLETKGGPNDQIPRYEPSYEIEIGTWKRKPYGANKLTNITSAFDGAKECLSKSEHTKDKRFVIFFSDGIASEPNTNPTEMNRYIQGVDVPTTFTIYYEATGSALTALNTMTSNIKSNGYSTSNPELTNIWDMAMDHDNLVELIIDKIIKKIITSSTTFTTSDIDVNGLGPVTGWDSTGFYFDNLFPLTGMKTPFAYDITYHVKKDSIDGADTITIEEFDTTFYYNYDVKISEGEPEEDSLILTYWGRNLEFYFEGTKLTEVGRDHDKIEVRFSPYEVDTTYDYDDITIELSLTNGSDEESIDLTKKGNYFSFEINREIGSASKGDGILQHENPDTIIALFKNGDLPLDTLEVKIPYFEGDYYKVTDAVYFDRDADGFVDELELTLDEEELDRIADTLIEHISLADYRDLSIDSYDINGKTLILNVTENSGEIKTYLNSDDKVLLSDTVALSDELFILPFEVSVVDSIAPVLFEATLLDSIKEGAKDYLEIVFSENMESIKTDEPFTFYKMSSGDPVIITLETLDENGEKATFLLKESSSLLSEVDSVNINSKADKVLGDTESVLQLNSKNRKVPLTKNVISDFVMLDEAVYFDTNGDGMVDKIDITFSMNIDSDSYDLVATSLKLCNRRDFELQSSDFSNGVLTLLVKEQSGVRATAVDEDDVVALSDTISLTGKYSLVPDTVTVIDSVAPVIEEAFYWSWNRRSDTLRVYFSEDIEGSGNETPFSLCDADGNNSYELVLGSGSVTGNSILYAVTGDDFARRGDSIRIDLDSKIDDALNNEQAVKENRRCELKFTNMIEEELLSAVYLDTSETSDGYIDRINLTLSEELPEAVVTKIINAVTLPAGRHFEDDREFEQDGKDVAIFVKQNRGEAGVPRTSIDEKDVITSLDECKVTLGDTTFIITSKEIEIADSLAPVVTRAEFHPMNSTKDEKIIDTLKLTFSEEIDALDEDFHFGFFDKSRGKVVSPQIKTNEGKKGKEVIYLVDAYDHYLPDPSDTDSLWILSSGEVTDVIGVEQNRNSVRVPLLVGNYNFLFDVSLFPNPYSFAEEEYVNPVLETYTPDVDLDAVAILVKPKGNRKIDGHISASILILDKVGNEIYTSQGSDFIYEEDSGVYVSSFKAINYQDRELGAGGYKILMDISFGDKGDNRVQKSLIFGVQE